VVTGAHVRRPALTGDNVAAFLIAFAGSVMMWWIYFDVGAERGAELIEHHAEPGRVARNAYTYLHMPIVAGIILARWPTSCCSRIRRARRRRWSRSSAAASRSTCSASAASSARQPLGKFPLSHLVGLGLLARSRCGPGWRPFPRCCSPA
jgi:hypothetical protein